MSDLSPLSGVKRKLDFGAVRTGFDPTATSARFTVSVTQRDQASGAWRVLFLN